MSLKLLRPIVVLAMILVACGGSTEGVDSVTSSTSSTELATNDNALTTDDAPTTDEPEDEQQLDEPTDSAEPVATAESTDPTAESSGDKSTLEDYLGVATGFVRGGGGLPTGGIDLERLSQEQQLIQIEIQRCMQQQGFEYTPEATSEGIRLFGGAEAQGLSAKEYAETEGFGITTRFDAVFEGDIDLTADEPTENEQLLDSLSEGEVDAWQFALGGAPPERNDQGQRIDPETGEVIQGGGLGPTGGCSLQATNLVRGDFSVLSELSDEFAELDERIDADRRISEIAADWTDCMRGLGFAYETVAEARSDFQQQLRPLLVAFFIGSGLQAQAGQGLAGQAANLQALADHGLTDDQEAELAAVQTLEIAAAVASLDCSGESQVEIDEITARYEADFVEANRSVLEQIAG